MKTTKKQPYYDPSYPYPFLPHYKGTIADREKIIRSRLKQLLADLEALEEKLSQNQNDIVLLADIEKCHMVVKDMLNI